MKLTLDEFYEIYITYQDLIKWENSDSLNFCKGTGLDKKIKNFYRKHKVKETEQKRIKDLIYLNPNKSSRTIREQLYEKKIS